jgi:diguanylate cyclase (GGDEF)-like protein
VDEPIDRARSTRAEAANELTALRAQAELARERLQRLQEDVVCEERRLGSAQSVQLREANEQLVLAMLRVQSETSAAVSSLARMTRLAELDSLTALPNRSVLFERCARAIANAKRRRTHVALLFLNLNKFRQINETLGREAGDQVLQLVAANLMTAVSLADTVSRYGGDEFLILLAEVRDTADAIVVAEKVVAALATPAPVAGHVLRLSASIGIALYPDHGDEANALINKADAAMRRAQKYGLGSFVFHGEPTPTSESAPLQLAQRGPLTQNERTQAAHDLHLEHLREANEQLVLAALNAQELQAAAQRAQRQQTEFLAVLAHELRNPLAPIRTSAALLGRVEADELPRLQGIIERQVKHLSRLVGDLFDVSRVSSGKLTLELQMLEMSAVIAEAVDACRPAMDLRLQRFGVYVPQRALNLRGDSIRLTQVLFNLLDNASKYTPVGGDIRMSVVVVSGTLVLTVSDNGIGIPAEALPRIFDPFVQDPRAVGIGADGLGLGLTVVRELVEAHGGTVDATSAGHGLGSQFVVTLPLSNRAVG